MLLLLAPVLHLELVRELGVKVHFKLENFQFFHLRAQLFDTKCFQLAEALEYVAFIHGLIFELRLVHFVDLEDFYFCLIEIFFEGLLLTIEPFLEAFV